MTEIRSFVREKYEYRCGYCGVAEVDTGNELEIDHFQPRSKGGSEEIDNLVYACTACNRNKADYWPSTDASPERRLLHPLENDFSNHIRMLENGLLDDISPRGKFHIEWLHLNRPQLIIHRKNRLIQAELYEAVARLDSTNRQLRAQIIEQKEELNELNQRIRRLQNRL